MNATIERLLRDKANCNTTDKFGNTPLHAMVPYNSCEGIEILIQHGAEINAVNREGCTALDLISVESTSVDNVLGEVLIKVDPNSAIREKSVAASAPRN